MWKHPLQYCQPACFPLSRSDQGSTETSFVCYHLLLFAQPVKVCDAHFFLLSGGLCKLLDSRPLINLYTDVNSTLIFLSVLDWWDVHVNKLDKPFPLDVDKSSNKFSRGVFGSKDTIGNSFIVEILMNQHQHTTMCEPSLLSFC